MAGKIEASMRPIIRPPNGFFCLLENIPIHSSAIIVLINEIFSPENKAGAQLHFRTRNPTNEELVQHYCQTGDFKKFATEHEIPLWSIQA